MENNADKIIDEMLKLTDDAGGKDDESYEMDELLSYLDGPSGSGTAAGTATLFGTDIVALDNNAFNNNNIQLIPPTTTYLPKFSPSPITITILDSNSSSIITSPSSSNSSLLSPSPSPPSSQTPSKRRKGSPLGDPTKACLPGYSKHGVKLGRKTSQEDDDEKLKEVATKKKVLHSEQIKSLVTLYKTGILTADEYIAKSVEATKLLD